MTLRLAFTLMMLVAAFLPGMAYGQPQQETTRPCLRLGADVSLGDSIAQFTALFDDLYGRIGRCAISVPMSPKRIEQLLENDGLDGDWFRPREYITDRNLEPLTVPQPVFAMSAHILWLESSGFSGNPADMQGLTVGHRDGYRWLERHIPMMGAKAFPISNSSQVKMLLLRGRIDLYATSSVNEAQIRRQFSAGDPAIKSAYWDKGPFLHILHPNHIDLIPALDKALRDMITTGALQQYLSMPGALPPDLLAPDN